MNKSDRDARDYLEQLGYQVKKIPESRIDGKSEADFIVEYKGCYDIAIIEAKLKTDDKEILRERENTLLAGKPFVFDAELGNNNSIWAISSKAKKQLLSSGDEHKHNYKILLFIADGINPDTKYEQILDTIYGRTRILEYNSGKIIPCYYFRNSIFYTRKVIDAVIVISNSRIQIPYFKLCLNNHSDNYQNMKESCFVKPFKNRIVDPEEEEKEGLAFLLDDDITRRVNELEEMLPSPYNPLLEHLQKKYDTGILRTFDPYTPTIEILS